MPKKTIRPTKNTVLSEYAQVLRTQFSNQYGADVVDVIVEGMIWFVSHNPTCRARSIDPARNRWVDATFTETQPCFRLVYVFTEGDEQRKIVKFTISPAEGDGTA